VNAKCALLALVLALAGGLSALAASVPATADVQAAYDAAAAESGAQHIAGLKILGVKCDLAPNGRYSCEVGFSQPNGDPDRVYLDVASLEATAGGWKLLSGLCRRFN
jgi:hypothetical protein